MKKFIIGIFMAVVISGIGLVFLVINTDKQGALTRSEVEHWTNITTPNVQTNYLVASGIGRLMGRVDYRASKKIRARLFIGKIRPICTTLWVERSIWQQIKLR